MESVYADEDIRLLKLKRDEGFLDHPTEVDQLGLGAIQIVRD